MPNIEGKKLFKTSLAIIVVYSPLLLTIINGFKTHVTPSNQLIMANLP